MGRFRVCRRAGRRGTSPFRAVVTIKQANNLRVIGSFPHRRSEAMIRMSMWLAVIALFAVRGSAADGEDRLRKRVFDLLFPTNCILGGENPYEELAKLGKKAMPIFKEVLSSDEPECRLSLKVLFYYLADAKGDWGELRPFVLQRLKDADAKVRAGATMALEKLGVPEDAPHLVPLLDDADRYIQLGAARLIGKLGGWPEYGKLAQWVKAVEAEKDPEAKAKRSYWLPEIREVLRGMEKRLRALDQS